MSSTVVCGYSDANWEVNSSGENACQVYAELQGQCNSTFTIRSVTSTSPAYTPPNNACGCNIVAYNLMGGCAWCQTGILTGWWLTIDQWIGNCTQAQFNPSAIPPTVPTAGINFPAWAFTIPSGTSWSPSQASFAAVSATPSLSTSSTTAAATGTGGFTFSTTRSSTTRGSDYDYGLTTAATNVGASVGIAFGVILGLWVLSIVVIIFIYIRRQSQRKAWYGPLAAFYQGQKSGYGGYAQYPPAPGAAVPLLYPTGSPHGEGFPTGTSPSNAHTVSTGGYQIPPAEASGMYPGGSPPAGYTAPYVPPPPEPNYHGAQAPHGAGGWGAGAAGNTASVYSGSGGAASGYGPNTASIYGSQAALPANPGPVGGTGVGGVPPGAPGPGAQGYRGHAEIY